MGPSEEKNTKITENVSFKPQGLLAKNKSTSRFFKYFDAQPKLI